MNRIKLLIAKILISKAQSLVMEAAQIYTMYPYCNGSIVWAKADILMRWADFYIELSNSIGIDEQKDERTGDEPI